MIFGIFTTDLEMLMLKNAENLTWCRPWCLVLVYARGTGDGRGHCHFNTNGL